MTSQPFRLEEDRAHHGKGKDRHETAQQSERGLWVEICLVLPTLESFYQFNKKDWRQMFFIRLHKHSRLTVTNFIIYQKSLLKHAGCIY